VKEHGSKECNEHKTDSKMPERKIKMKVGTAVRKYHKKGRKNKGISEEEELLEDIHGEA
jgi:hypothetical protein